MIETQTVKSLDEVLPVVRELSVHDKLVLAQILVKESLRDPLLAHLPKRTVVELYSPIEVSGNLTSFARLLNSSMSKRASARKSPQKKKRVANSKSRHSARASSHRT